MKEILNQQIIEKELKDQCIHAAISIGGVLCLCVLLALLTILDTPKNPLLILLILLLSTVALAVTVLSSKIILYATALITKNVTIVEDVVKEREKTNHHSRYSWYTVYTLIFRHFGQAALPHRSFRHTEQGSVSAQELYEATKDGDEFYLLITSDEAQAILAVFPKDRFQREC
ncbi:MAG: hypothetical protein IIX85_00340 [Clostridia bacterium]|nr:hypothetical protein [Clostridia bacterium]